jgi:hypothetical protein
MNKAFLDALKLRAGADSILFREAMKEIRSKLDSSNRDSDLFSKYKLWQIVSREIAVSTSSSIDQEFRKRFRINSRDDYLKTLYSLQSYYTLLLQTAVMNKILCLADDSYAPGEVFESYELLSKRFPGILDGAELAPFSCWLEKGHLTTDLLVRMLKASEDINEWSASWDNIQSFYQDIFGNGLRKSLGEFYTQDWIAELILDKVGYRGDGSVLDPACGSGVFLIKAIYRAMRSDLSRGVLSRWNHALGNIIGFDLNPVAVFSSKLNYLMTLADSVPKIQDFPNLLESTWLPIHWTNSIIWHENDLQENSTVLTTPFGVFRVPLDPACAFSFLKRRIKEKYDEKNLPEDSSAISKMAYSFISPLRYGKFDFVVGNPPWVSPDRMEKQYRDHVSNLLSHSGYLEPYEPALPKLASHLPSRQFGAALPFFASSLRHFLKEGGACGFLVTSSLLKSLNAGGFRMKISEYYLKELLDFTPYTNIHEGAMCWAFVPIIIKEHKPESATSYDFFVPSNKASPIHEKTCEKFYSPSGEEFYVCSWKIQISKMRLDTGNARSPWFSAPQNVVDIYRMILDNKRFEKLGNLYSITRGIVTGADKVYVIEDLALLPEQKAQIATGVAPKGAIVESKQIFPFVQGKHLNSWKFKYAYIVLPYDIKSWQIIDEQQLGRDFPLLMQYFRNHRNILESRKTISIKGKIERGKSFYVVETRSDIGKSWLVGIKEVSQILESTVIPPTISTILGRRPTIVGHTLNYIRFPYRDEAYYVSAIINSWLARVIAYDLGIPKGGYPCKRYDMWLIANLPIPPYSDKEYRCIEISNLAEEAHKEASYGKPEEVARIQQQLQELVTSLYDIPPNQVDELRKHYEILSGTNTSNTQ